MDEPGMPPPDEAPPPLGIPPPLLLPEEPPELPFELPEDPLEPALPPLEELLDELLEERLPEEPLDPELLGDGMEAEGIDGVDGVVGVLAEGQPAINGKVTITAENHFMDCQFMLKPPRPNRRAMPNALGQIPR
jgi:hypothetical protein